MVDLPGDLTRWGSGLARGGAVHLVESESQTRMKLGIDIATAREGSYGVRDNE